MNPRGTNTFTAGPEIAADTGDAAAPHPALVALILCLILCGGLFLRAWRIDSVPPGLWFDEALNAQDAAAVAEGAPFRIVYPDEFPREPMFVTLLALAGKAFGSDIGVFRGVSIGISMLTLLATFALARMHLGARTALVITAVLASMRWHIIFSRLLFRTLLLPLWIPLVLIAATHCARKRSPLAAAVLGLTVGLGFYTYLAWYFVLPGVALACAAALWRGSREDGTHGASRASRVSAFAVALLISAGPILIHYLRFPDHLFSRAGAVSPFAGENAAAAVGRNLLQALGMFHYRGDHVPKHNIPGMPALDPIQGLFFLAGLAVCLLRLKSRPVVSVTLIGWIALSLLATVLTITDSPNFLRTLAAAPAVAALVGMGLDETARRWAAALGPSRRAVVRVMLLSMVLLCSGAISARQVCVRWARLPAVWESFNGPESDLGRSAAATPRGTTFHIPEYLSLHRSFRFLSREAGAEILPFSDFDFLRTPTEPRAEGPRRIVCTANNRLLAVLEALAPGGRIVQEFSTPDGRVWAVLYEIEPGDLPPADAVESAEAAHATPEGRIDIRW